MRGQRGAEVVADRDGDQVHRGGRDGDAAEHDPPAVAQRERHRHQLGLVAELGDEDDGEAQQQCGEHASTPPSCGCRQGLEQMPPAGNRYGRRRPKVSPTGR